MPFLMLVIAAFVLLIAFLMGPPESNPKTQDLDIPFASSGQQRDAGDLLDHELRLLQVNLDFEEGLFEIRPAQPGQPIRIDAEYDEGLFRLETEQETTREGERRFKLAFARRGNLVLLRQIVHRQLVEDVRLRLELPPDIPIDLSIRLRKGEGDFDLSGLTLRNLSVDHAMGYAEIYFEEPNPLIMQSLAFKARMGELVVSGLGNAAARELAFDGKMGDFQLDFEGAWRTHTIADFNLQMGSAQIRIPRSVDLHMQRSTVFLGELQTSRSRSSLDPESDNTNVLSVKASVSLGDMAIR